MSQNTFICLIHLFRVKGRNRSPNKLSWKSQSDPEMACFPEWHDPSLLTTPLFGASRGTQEPYIMPPYPVLHPCEHQTCLPSAVTQMELLGRTGWRGSRTLTWKKSQKLCYPLRGLRHLGLPYLGHRHVLVSLVKTLTLQCFFASSLPSSFPPPPPFAS